MPDFSTMSLKRLKTCHPDLQRLFRAVVEHFDCTVLDGHRNEARQNALFEAGNSKLRFPGSKHNAKPSLAVDVAPYVDGRVSFDDRQCLFFGGVVKGVARKMGIGIRWGGDWDGDLDVNDQGFNDLVHFELTGGTAA